MYAAYKAVKDSKPLRYGSIGLVLLIMTVLILLREPTDPNAKHRLDFDPYEVLQVPRNATSSQINRAFRQLAVRMHPDKISSKSTEEEAEMHKRLFIRVQQSAEILRDETKRRNFDEHGNPDGPPEDSWWEESYPDWIMNPGKKFVLFYVFLLGTLAMVPFCAIFLVPALEEPMGTIVDHVHSRIAQAEELLLDDQLEAAGKVLEEVQQVWDSLLEKFPMWAESQASMFVDFRVACRTCQLLLVKGDENDEKRKRGSIGGEQLMQQQVNKVIGDFKSKYIKSSAFGNREATSRMLPYALDVKSTLISVNMPASVQKNILKNMAGICRKVL